MRAKVLPAKLGKRAISPPLARWSVALLAASACLQAAAGDSGIAKAARVGDLEQIRQLIAAGGDVNVPEADGSTALLWAAYQSDAEMVTALIEAGADPDAANEFGVTPLLQASRNGDPAVIEALLNGGADIELTHPQGETPLMAASRSGSVAAVSLLLARGSNPNAVESVQEQTALMWAVAEGHLDVVDVLLGAGADPNMRARISTLTERSINADFPTGGFTALMWAARNGDEAIVRRLIEGGADPKLTNGDGATATIIAIVNDRFDLAATLVELGSDANDGSLYHAVEMRDATTDWFAHDGSRLRADHPNDLNALDLAKALLEAGADPYKRDGGHKHSATMCCDTVANGSPFFGAAVAADVEALKLLIEHGADLEWTPTKVEGKAPGANQNVGKTPLMVAMNGGQGVGMSGGPGDIREGRPPPFREISNREPADAVRVLLEAGANPDAVAPDGSAAIHQAALGGKLDVIRALADAGATLDSKNGDGLTALDLAENPKPKPDGLAGLFGPPPGASPEEVAALLRELMQTGSASAAAQVDGDSAQ
jgi:ankyrin repeat protein